MKVETREFNEGRVRHLIVLPEAEESRLVDWVFGDKLKSGDGLIASVMGEVRLADGYGEHYIRLEQARGLILEKHLLRQREFSERTFGPGARAKGVVDHIRKELDEVEANPADLSEWIDVAILALDGAWRAGYSPEEITRALVAKQTKNELRNWPDWRTAPTDQAIEHDRAIPEETMPGGMF